MKGYFFVLFLRAQAPIAMLQGFGSFIFQNPLRLILKNQGPKWH